MKNCLIMGSGRSGTSMLSGILHASGYFMGEKLHLPRESNPKGFFEWWKINLINEEILAPFGSTAYSRLINKLRGMNSVRSPGNKQRWLLSLPESVRVRNESQALMENIRSVIANPPFCFKDPRFCYTLPVWRPLLDPETVFICVFREPHITAESILRECRARDYLQSLHITRDLALQVWYRMYSHLLAWNADVMHRFFFVHYDQVYDGSAMEPLSQFLDVKLNSGFVDQSLKRTVSSHVPPRKASALYRRLCELANYPQAQ